MQKNKKIAAYPNQNAATNAIPHGVFQQNRPEPIVHQQQITLPERRSSTTEIAFTRLFNLPPVNHIA